MKNLLAQNMVTPYITEPPTLTLQQQLATVEALKILWTLRFSVILVFILLFVFRKKLSNRVRVILIFSFILFFAITFYVEYLLFGYVNLARFFMKHAY
jgi:hypothetical protein